MFTIVGMSPVPSQKPANILVMGEGPERGRVKIGTYNVSFFKISFTVLSLPLLH